VKSGRRLGGVELARRYASRHLLEQRCSFVVVDAEPETLGEDRLEPLAGIELAPRGHGGQGEGEQLAERAEPPVAAPVVRGAAVRGRSGHVRRGQSRTERLRLLPGRAGGLQPFEEELVLASLDHRDHRRAARNGGQPAQPRCLPREVAEGHVRPGLPEGRSRHTRERSSDVCAGPGRSTPLPASTPPRN
jgi:hypothetical protein